MNKKLGIYIHIPYCLQRCSYCDFATYTPDQIPAQEKYFELVRREISQRHHWANRPAEPLASIYFGGGTPSLAEPQQLAKLLEHIKSFGFEISNATEITIEINPATVSEASLKSYLEMGINRFSVGAQTFSNDLLKAVGRKHSSQDTIDTLSILKSRGLNYSFDLLFALPGQTLSGLERDLAEIERLRPPHISPYCLTVPDSHPLAKSRLLDSLQIQMFERIHERLSLLGYIRYEISNYCLPGFESRHNHLYWDDQDYWGVGLSSHSYLKGNSLWGQRFWNPRSYHAYAEQVSSPTQSSSPDLALPSEQYERLSLHQYLTDFCHTSLRKASGLELGRLIDLLRPHQLIAIEKELDSLQERKLIERVDGFIRLTEAGVLLSNQVFTSFTFLPDDLR